MAHAAARDSPLVAFLRTVRPEWSSWDLLRAAQKLKKVDVHSAEELVRLAEAGSLNVRLMAHGEKPFYEKTVRRIVEVHQGHEAPVFGAVKPPPRRSGPATPRAGSAPRSARTPRSPEPTPPTTSRTPRPSPPSAARSSVLRGVASGTTGMPLFEDSDDGSFSDGTSLGSLDEDVACRMADFMQQQTAHIRASVARTQVEIDNLMNRVQGSIKRGQRQRRASMPASKASARVPKASPRFSAEDDGNPYTRLPSPEPRPRSPRQRTATRDRGVGSGPAPAPKPEASGTRGNQAGFRFGDTAAFAPAGFVPRAPRGAPTAEDQLRAELGRVRQLPEQQKRKELKKLAVKWHPDRNKEHPELATRLFQLIEF